MQRLGFKDKKMQGQSAAGLYNWPGLISARRARESTIVWKNVHMTTAVAPERPIEGRKTDIFQKATFAKPSGISFLGHVSILSILGQQGFVSMGIRRQADQRKQKYIMSSIKGQIGKMLKQNCADNAAKPPHRLRDSALG